MASGDVDGDANLDIVTLRFDVVHVHLNGGDESWKEPVRVVVPLRGHSGRKVLSTRVGADATDLQSALADDEDRSPMTEGHVQL